MTAGALTLWYGWRNAERLRKQNGSFRESHCVNENNYDKTFIGNKTTSFIYLLFFFSATNAVDRAGQKAVKKKKTIETFALLELK